MGAVATAGATTTESAPIPPTRRACGSIACFPPRSTRGEPGSARHSSKHSAIRSTALKNRTGLHAWNTLCCLQREVGNHAQNGERLLSDNERNIDALARMNPAGREALLFQTHFHSARVEAGLL